MKNKIIEWLELIKFEHTIFALPFALSGMVLAKKGLPPLSTFLWVIIAFTGARAAAMSLNRLIDASIDSKNPRTQQRAIPQGRINKRQASLFALLSFVIMLIAAAQLPPLCLKLSPVAIIWLSFYSYSKRFTSLCHLFLGIALGGAALGGWIAAGGNLYSPTIWLLFTAVTFWVAGFDIIYACQDFHFDQQEKLFSLPSEFGLEHALLISRGLHFLTVSALILLGYISRLGPIYWLGIAVVACMLIYEQRIVSAHDLSKVNAAFFNVNGIVSILAFISIFTDHLLHY